MGLGNCTCHVKVELAEALSFCFRDARYPQHLMRSVRIEVTDGVLDQVNTVAVQDQAAGRAIDADFCDHAAKNDLAVAQQFQERICVGIREHVDGLLFEDDLRIAAEVPGQIDLAVWNDVVLREERTLDLFLSRRAGEAVGWVLAEFGIDLRSRRRSGCHAGRRRW